MTNSVLPSEPQPIMNYFVIILILAVFVVGITLIPDSDQERIKEAGRVIYIMLSMICVLIGLIILFKPHRTETLNNTPIV